MRYVRLLVLKLYIYMHVHVVTSTARRVGAAYKAISSSVFSD